MKSKKIRIGSRGSKLALWQAEYVKKEIEKIDADYKVTIEIIKTKGDKITDVPLAKVGGKILFVKEIENALLDLKIDIAVHSMKDMPADIPEGLCIGAVPDREDFRDVLVSKNNIKLMELKKGALVGTSSIRRSAQLLYARPDLKIFPLRGNLDTRLKKFESENFDAIILAAAGMKRLKYDSYITEYISEKKILPAVGQGALCIETREDDQLVSEIVSKLDSEKSRLEVFGERAFLHKLEGGCQMPVAALGKIENGVYTLTGLVADIFGREMIKEKSTGELSKSEEIGIKLAGRLISLGANDILKGII